MDKYVLFPACAGVILLCGEFLPFLTTFPRVCGGDDKTYNDLIKSENFSPRVRG